MAKLIEPSTQLTDTVSAVAFQMIGDKEFSTFDLSQHLKKHHGSISPTNIIKRDGTNLLQEMVDKGRLSMFICIITLGWWTVLLQKKIPKSSLSEHKGCNALQIAEKKRTRKPYEEVQHYTNWENSLTPLMKACRSGDIAKVKMLINNVGDLQETYLIDFNGWNALHWAIVNGNVEIIQILLDTGVDASVKTKKNETVLHIACMFGQFHLISILLTSDKCKLDPYVDDLYNKSPYDKVGENGDIETLNELRKCSFQPNPTFLVLAAYNGRQKLVEVCIHEMKMDINGHDIYERTALHRACENKKIGVVKFLVQNGADVSAETTSKRNVLHIIAEAGSIVVFTYVMDKLKKGKLYQKLINEKDRYNGVELCFLIRGRDRGRDAWHYVEAKRWLVPLFLKNTRSGNVDVAEYGKVFLSGWGVNPDQENITTIERIFKERKLNKEAELDMTPLHIATFKGHVDIVKQLLQFGANVNAKDCFSLTPIMLASSSGNLDIVKLLETSGAIFDELSSEGKNAITVAEENEQDSIVAYIKGMDLLHICQNFVRGHLAHYKTELSRPRLEEVRANGEDVKVHIVDALRNMRIDINQTLQKLGSGPVLEATED